MEKTGLDKIPARIDSALFDSGSIAKEKRNEKRAEITQNNITTNQMKNAGDEAVNDYKDKNANNLAKMNDQERKDKLNEVRNEAMRDKGKELGLNESKINKIMDKGNSFKTTSDNALMIASKYAYHNAFGNKDGLNNNKVNTDLSLGNLKNAAKDMNTEERKDFMDNLKNNPNASDKEKENINKFEQFINDKK